MLTSNRVRISDRPPQVEMLAERLMNCRTPFSPSRNSWRVAAWSLAFGSLLFAVSAWGASNTRPRTDPGTPPADPGGTDEGWWVQTIPGLPALASLGDVWVSTSGTVYVWANYPHPGRTSQGQLEEPGEGEKQPGEGRDSAPTSSTLYAFDGKRWTASLYTAGETGVALYGTDDANVYASTTGAQGEARLYRLDGRTWRQQVVPGYHLGRLHTLAGVRGDLYFMIDRVVLCDRDNGRGFQPVYELAGGHDAVRGLVYLGRDHVMVLESGGYAFNHAGVWSDRVSAPFADVHDAWGVRDDQGQLQVYALGSAVADNGLRVWRFDEENPVTHAGTWRCAHADPITNGPSGIGCGLHTWGSSGSDVYATGMVDGEVHLLRRDGVGWSQLTPPVTPGSVHGVFGDGQGQVWFSLDQGRMLRYVRPAAVVPTPGVVNEPGSTNAVVLSATSGVGGVYIRYQMAQAGLVDVSVYDAAGRWCATLEDRFRARGAHELTWVQGGMRSGVYFIRFRSGGSEFCRRIVLLR